MAPNEAAAVNSGAFRANSGEFETTDFKPFAPNAKTTPSTSSMTTSRFDVVSKYVTLSMAFFSESKCNDFAKHPPLTFNSYLSINISAIGAMINSPILLLLIHRTSNES